MNISAVEKGIRFEKRIIEKLTEAGFKAHRTNVTNEHDPENYKHGFDGGVDIIATYELTGTVNKSYTFYIQCKNHAKDLTKTAISEVYAGMKVRNATGIPVVIAMSNASQETRQYAKELGVELYLIEEDKILKDAKKTGKVAYGNYGVLLKLMLYHYTKDTSLLATLPDCKGAIKAISQTDQFIEDAKKEFDRAQTFLDYADSCDKKAKENRQKALDIQRIAVYRNIRAMEELSKDKKGSRDRERTTIAKDSG